jgi:hypothetical protein
MVEFVETTPPAQVDPGRWGELLRSGSPELDDPPESTAAAR